MSKQPFSRRQFMRGLGGSLASVGLGGLLTRPRPARAQGMPQEPYFLITVCAAGGASMIDAFLAIRASESARAADINTFPDAAVTNIADSPFRAVTLQRTSVGPLGYPVNADQRTFVQRHHADMMVAPVALSSVNHRVAQQRAMNGSDAWRGRTLAECVANQYGAGFALPNVNMSFDGYFDRGIDASLPAYAYHVPVTEAATWPMGIDGYRGIPDLPRRPLFEEARQIRNDVLDASSPFGRTFRDAPRVRVWEHDRSVTVPRLEQADLITALMLLQNGAQTPLNQYGLLESPDGERIRARFPRLYTDPAQAKAALTFLLIKNRVSCTVSFSTTFAANIDNARRTLINPPLSFDFSHYAHRSTQALMWSNLLGVIDGLIELLREEVYDTTTGETFWDRTLIYLATDFGRMKNRPPNADEFGTGHDLNNAVLLVSPLVNGNTVLGGVDPDTGLTYGFDGETGAPVRGHVNEERDVFAGILHALRVDTTGSGLPNMRAMRRTA